MVYDTNKYMKTRYAKSLLLGGEVTPVLTMLVSPGGTNQSHHAKII